MHFTLLSLARILIGDLIFIGNMQQVVELYMIGCNAKAHRNFYDDVGVDLDLRVSHRHVRRSYMNIMIIIYITPNRIFSCNYQLELLAKFHLRDTKYRHASHGC